jgi:hypothetical protein
MIAEQHRAYRKWLMELNFYEDEMIIFQKELDLLVDQHPELLSILEHVEEYKRIFKRKKEKLKVLQDLIISKGQMLNSDNLNQENLQSEFESIQKQQTAFVKKIEKLKKNFKRFVSKNMF